MRRPLRIAVVIGLGVALAPAIFQMFTRAPKGGQMITEFAPFMTQAKITTFSGYLDRIGATEREVARAVRPQAARRLGMDRASFDRAFPQTVELTRRWAGIRTDMDDMLGRMQHNLDNYAAVKALPPFVVFPWFFVLPGLLIAAAAWAGLRAVRTGVPARRARIALGVLGLGLVAAPAVFGMFTRAPQGGRMISEFTSMMTTERVRTVQGYFLVLAGAEGELRTQVKPRLTHAGMDARAFAAAFPAAARFGRDWPKISAEMAPMVGAMSDNVDNFAAVKALPPFGLFPWFFVLPGLIVAACALAASRTREPAPVRPLSPAGVGTALSEGAQR